MAMYHGDTQLTRIPSPAHSQARFLVWPATENMSPAACEHRETTMSACLPIKCPPAPAMRQRQHLAIQVQAGLHVYRQVAQPSLASQGGGGRLRLSHDITSMSMAALVAA